MREMETRISATAQGGSDHKTQRNLVSLLGTRREVREEKGIAAKKVKVKKKKAESPKVLVLGKIFGGFAY